MTKKSEIIAQDADFIEDAIEKAREEEKNTIKFKGHEMLLGYAKYLVEYLRTLKE